MPFNSKNNYIMIEFKSPLYFHPAMFHHDHTNWLQDNHHPIYILLCSPNALTRINVFKLQHPSCEKTTSIRKSSCLVFLQLTAWLENKHQRGVTKKKHLISRKPQYVLKTAGLLYAFLLSLQENINLISLAKVKFYNHTLTNFPQMHGCTSHNLHEAIIDSLLEEIFL
jgi:hypothetical protein